jgi:hypothetical protein
MTKRVVEYELSESPYFSYLLTQVPEDLRPSPMPACATCPASLWRGMPDDFECICLTVGRTSWNDKMQANPTLFCDGRERAIARYVAEQE